MIIVYDNTNFQSAELIDLGLIQCTEVKTPSGILGCTRCTWKATVEQFNITRRTLNAAFSNSTSQTNEYFASRSCYLHSNSATQTTSHAAEARKSMSEVSQQK
jgi:hypothetical protein